MIKTKSGRSIEEIIQVKWAKPCQAIAKDIEDDLIIPEGMRWIHYSERMPTEKDSDDVQYIQVGNFKESDVCHLKDYTEEYKDKYPYWMPFMPPEPIKKDDGFDQWWRENGVSGMPMGSAYAVWQAALKTKES